MNLARRLRAQLFVRRGLVADFVVQMTVTGVVQFLARQMLAREMFARQMIDGGDVVEMFLVVKRKRNLFVVRVRGVQCLARQQFDGGSCRAERLRRTHRDIVRVAVIVIFKILENIADV